MLIDLTFNPIIVRFGPYPFGWASVFATFGMVAALALAWRRARGYGLPADRLEVVASVVLVGGVVGSRLLIVIDHLPFYLANPSAARDLANVGGGSGGAWVGGIVAGLLVSRSVGLPLGPLLDAATPAALVGQCISWLGSLSSGAAWGVPTGGAWGVVYWNPNDVLPPRLLGTPIHPYPLYQMLGDVLVLLGLWLARSWWSGREGHLFLAAIVPYAVLQLGLGFFRDDVSILGALRMGQLVALGVLGGMLFVLLERHCRAESRISCPEGGDSA